MRPQKARFIDFAKHDNIIAYVPPKAQRVA
jgi:hypothetical protein